MGVQCQIIIKPAQNGDFRPGQSVAGTVRYFINKATKFRTIDITFLGKGMCIWSESRYEFENEEIYVNVNKNLFKPRPDQEVLLSGNFEHPFEFLLPYDIPSSIKYNIRCKIEYKIIVTFVKAKGLTSINEFTKEIPVYGYATPCSPEPRIFRLEKNSFKVNAEIERTFLAPGESIRLKIAIKNDSDATITIKSALIEYFRFVSDDGRTHEVVQTIKERSTNVTEKIMSQIICVIPTLPNSYSVQHANALTRGYKVRVTAELPDPHANAEVEVPVVIGERREHLEAIDDENKFGNPLSTKEPGIEDLNLIEL